MALKSYKPNTPGLRQKTVLVNTEITATKPEKSLTTSLNKNAGRDTFGRISVRRRGGGHKLRMDRQRLLCCGRRVARSCGSVGLIHSW